MTGNCHTKSIIVLIWQRTLLPLSTSWLFAPISCRIVQRMVARFPGCTFFPEVVGIEPKIVLCCADATTLIIESVRLKYQRALATQKVEEISGHAIMLITAAAQRLPYLELTVLYLVTRHLGKHLTATCINLSSCSLPFLHASISAASWEKSSFWHSAIFLRGEIVYWFSAWAYGKVKSSSIVRSCMLLIWLFQLSRKKHSQVPHSCDFLLFKSCNKHRCRFMLHRQGFDCIEPSPIATLCQL